MVNNVHTGWVTTEKLNNFGINKNTAAVYRSRGIGPKYYKRGRKIYYKVEDIKKWLEEEPIHTIDSVQFEPQGL